MSIYQQNECRVDETIEVLLSLQQTPNYSPSPSAYPPSSPSHSPLVIKEEEKGKQDRNLSLTPFYGRAEVLGSSSPVVTDLLDEVCCLGGEIHRYAESDPEWARLYGCLDHIRNQIISNQFEWEYFRLEIFRTAIIPAIRKLKTSRHTTNNRFTQIQLIMGVLFPQSSTPDHPANTLMDLEKILSKMRYEKGGWNSVLVTYLQDTLQLEWLPILLDNRRALQKLGSKMILIGLLDHFRSAFFILPVLLLLAEVSLIVRQINHHHGLSGQSIMKLLKSFVLLCLGGLAVKIIGFLPGFGLSSAIFGVIALLVSADDFFLKLACPYIAPNLARLSSFLAAIDSFDDQIMPEVMGSLNPSQSSMPKKIGNNRRVERLHED